MFCLLLSYFHIRYCLRFFCFSIAHDLDVSLLPGWPKGERNFLRRLVWIDGRILCKVPKNVGDE